MEPDQSAKGCGSVRERRSRSFGWQHPILIHRHQLELSMSDPVEIENSVEDPPFGWTSRYQAVLNDDRIDVRLRIKLKSDQRIPLKDTLKIRAETEESVEHYFNGRFEMIDRDGRVHFLTVKPEF